MSSISFNVSDLFAFPLLQSFYLKNNNETIYSYVVTNDDESSEDYGKTVFSVTYNAVKNEPFYFFGTNSPEQRQSLTDHYSSEFMRKVGLMFMMEYIREVASGSGDYLSFLHNEIGFCLFSSTLDILDDNSNF